LNQPPGAKVLMGRPRTRKREGVGKHPETYQATSGGRGKKFQKKLRVTWRILFGEKSQDTKMNCTGRVGQKI